MNDGTMERLVAARPPHLDPDARPRPDTRARELAAAFGSPRTRGRKARRLLTLPRGLAITGVAAAAAVAVIASMSTTTTPRQRSTTPTPTPLSARQVLLAAATASAAATPTVSKDTYWVTQDEYIHLCVMGGRPVMIGTQDKNWYTAQEPAQTPAHLAKEKAVGGPTVNQYIGWRGLGVLPSGAVNMTSWKKPPGPATTWPPLQLGKIPSGFQCSDQAKATPWQIDSSDTSDVSPFADGSLAQIQRMPTTPAGLRAYFATHPHGSCSMQGISDSECDLIMAATDLLSSEPAPPNVRSAAFRLIADMPGSRSMGWVTDPLGRHGYVVDIPSAGPTVIDPATGTLLGTEDLVDTPALARTSHLPVGTVVSWMVILPSTWTNTAPRHYTIPPG